MARKHPVSSFGPELMATLLAGATSTRSIEMPWHRAARFRQRLYMLRQAMGNEQHPQYEDVRRVFIRIVWPDDTKIKLNSKKVRTPIDPNTPCKVLVGPQDSEYAASLKSAGIELGDAPDDLLADLEKEQQP